MGLGFRAPGTRRVPVVVAHRPREGLATAFARDCADADEPCSAHDPTVIAGWAAELARQGPVDDLRSYKFRHDDDRLSGGRARPDLALYIPRGDGLHRRQVGPDRPLGHGNVEESTTYGQWRQPRWQQ